MIVGDKKKKMQYAHNQIHYMISLSVGSEWFILIRKHNCWTIWYTEIYFTYLESEAHFKKPWASQMAYPVYPFCRPYHFINPEFCSDFISLKWDQNCQLLTLSQNVINFPSSVSIFSCTMQWDFITFYFKWSSWNLQTINFHK